MLRAPRLCALLLTNRPAALFQLQISRTMSLFNTTRLQGETVLITGASGGWSHRPAALVILPSFDRQAR